MSLAHCTLAKECAFCVVAHALSTEKQEVMGLLFGRWDGSQAFVEEAHPLARTDRRADRVEVKPEQLAKAASIAESRGLRIVGWYHSHPQARPPRRKLEGPERRHLPPLPTRNTLKEIMQIRSTSPVTRPLLVL